MALFIGRAGQMTGVLPFSRMKSYGGQGFAVTACLGAVHSRRSSLRCSGHPLHGPARRLHACSTASAKSPASSSRRRSSTPWASWPATWPTSSTIPPPPPSAPRPAWSPNCAPIAQNRFKLVNLCLSEEQIERPSRPGSRKSSTAPASRSSRPPTSRCSQPHRREESHSRLAHADIACPTPGK
jgi:hypothetical protein